MILFFIQEMREGFLMNENRMSCYCSVRCFRVLDLRMYFDTIFWECYAPFYLGLINDIAWPIFTDTLLFKLVKIFLFHNGDGHFG
jgi:hypothetical protein